MIKIENSDKKMEIETAGTPLALAVNIALAIKAIHTSLVQNNPAGAEEFRELTLALVSGKSYLWKLDLRKLGDLVSVYAESPIRGQNHGR